jgi:branched-subunit amino acid ABC-type transport system permease component
MSRSKEAVLGPFFLIGEPAYGIIFGRALMLIGSGLSLKFGVMGILNFAHGGFCMLGAYFVSWFRSLREFLGFADPGPFVGDRDRCPD